MIIAPPSSGDESEDEILEPKKLLEPSKIPLIIIEFRTWR